MKSVNQTTAGFTLIELLVVITILGILAAVAMPSMQGITQGQRAKNAGFEIYAALTTARSEAIKRNNTVTVTPIGTRWENGWNITDSNNVRLRTHEPLKGIVITLAPTSLTFNRNGRIQGNGFARFQIDVGGTTVSRNVRCVGTELSGMPRIIKGAC